MTVESFRERAEEYYVPLSSMRTSEENKYSSFTIADTNKTDGFTDGIIELRTDQKKRFLKFDKSDEEMGPTV